jgi:hypothetical protein
MGEEAGDVLPTPVRWLFRLAWLSVFVVTGYLAWDIRMCTCLRSVLKRAWLCTRSPCTHTRTHTNTSMCDTLSLPQWQRSTCAW